MINVKEAREILAEARKRWSQEDITSKVNPSMTTLQAVEIVEAGIAKMKEDEVLSHLFEKRVHQVYRNQINPRF